MVVAIVVSFAAICLKWFIHFIESLLLNTSLLELSFANLFLPLVGILLSLLFVKYALRNKNFEKGLAAVIYKVNYKKGKIELFHSYAHLITSAFTVSLGGSVGVEAPIAATGSAIGSNLASRFFLSENDRNLLLACGASAGISAIFNCPIGAVIFALEVILRRVAVPAFVPLLIASATASVISNMFYTSQIISFTAQAWQIEAIPYYVVLAIICALFSVYTIRVIYGLETRFNNVKLKYNKAIIQGLIVGALILVSPLLYGEGYFVINQILNKEFDAYMRGIALQSNFGYDTIFLTFVLGTLLLKPIATALTVSAGGNGGIFAPSLFIGALCGLLFSRGMNLLGWTSINELNFVVAGMAGVLSGVLSAPLTGIFMIAEVAGGYTLLVPLMIVSAGSFFITNYNIKTINIIPSFNYALIKGRLYIPMGIGIQKTFSSFDSELLRPDLSSTSQTVEFYQIPNFNITPNTGIDLTFNSSQKITFYSSFKFSYNLIPIKPLFQDYKKINIFILSASIGIKI